MHLAPEMLSKACLSDFSCQSPQIDSCITDNNLSLGEISESKLAVPRNLRVSPSPALTSTHVLLVLSKQNGSGTVCPSPLRYRIDQSRSQTLSLSIRRRSQIRDVVERQCRILAPSSHLQLVERLPKLPSASAFASHLLTCLPQVRSIGQHRIRNVAILVLCIWSPCQ